MASVAASLFHRFAGATPTPTATATTMATAVAQKVAEVKPILATIAVIAVSALLGAWLVRFNRERPRSVSLPRPEQAKAGWKPERILSPPGVRDAKRPNLIIAYDPATGGYLDELPADTPDTIEEKLKRAEVAQAAWKRSSWSRRRIVLKTIKKWLVDDVETICRVACRDTGKTVSSHRQSPALSPSSIDLTERHDALFIF